ncbi:MAG: helix-turn-helix domain-containing protein [Haloarculaceae archaeon]
MSVIATIEVPAEDFALEGAITDGWAIRVRLVHVVPVSGSFVPYFWASNDHIKSITSALEAADDLGSFHVVDEANGEALVRTEWIPQDQGLLTALDDADGTMLEGVGERGTWRFEIRFPTHDDLTEFFRSCTGSGLDIDLQSVHNPGVSPAEDRSVEFTEPQRETLHLALERGYFEVPRDVDLVGLAEELEVSDTAVSQRLRRAISTLLQSTLTVESHKNDDGRRD